MRLDVPIFSPKRKVYSSQRKLKPGGTRKPPMERVKDRERERARREVEIRAQIAARDGPAYRKLLVELRSAQEISISAQGGRARSKYLDDLIRARTHVTN